MMMKTVREIVKDALKMYNTKLMDRVIDPIIQESAFEIVVENNEYVLYWHGAEGECPYTLTLEDGEYVLNFNYTSAS
jgi:hypothetical protein